MIQTPPSWIGDPGPPLNKKVGDVDPSVNKKWQRGKYFWPGGGSPTSHMRARADGWMEWRRPKIFILKYLLNYMYYYNNVWLRCIFRQFFPPIRFLPQGGLKEFLLGWTADGKKTLKTLQYKFLLKNLLRPSPAPAATHVPPAALAQHVFSSKT